MDASVLTPLAVALGLGLLVGMQREWAVDEIAGIRTFALITLLGAVAGLLAEPYGGWMVAAGALGVVTLIAVANVVRLGRDGSLDAGITTEVAALLMYGVGALLASGATTASVVLAGAVAVLLHWKQPLHRWVDRMEHDDVSAVIRLVLIGLVILPVLPNREFGPYGVLNPFEIWLMVVLIVGLSLAGYVAFVLFGSRGGAVVSGVLGGMISSTATTVSYARRSAAEPDRSPAAAVVVMLASVVVFGRVLVEMGLVAPGSMTEMAPPILTMMAIMGVVAGVLVLGAGDTREREVRDRQPPSDLKAAVVFGALYAAVLLAVALAREHLGQGALYGVAAVSGLTDVDAITLSTAQMVNSGGLDAAQGWRVILVGSLSNLVFKAGMVVALGHRRLRGRILTAFGVSLAAGIALLLLWPG